MTSCFVYLQLKNSTHNLVLLDFSTSLRIIITFTDTATQRGACMWTKYCFLKQMASEANTKSSLLPCLTLVF